MAITISITENDFTNIQLLIYMCEKLLKYRKNNLSNFQLEKLDDYLKLIEKDIDNLGTGFKL